MSGWPNRPGRDSWGQEYSDSTPVRDPRKQIAAAMMNLDFWQVAGMSQVSPRAFLHFQGGASPVILNRAEAWNPRALDTGDFADPSFVSVATGNYLIEYPSPQLDEVGDSQALSFLFALAFPATEDSATLEFAKASVISTNRRQVRVTTWTSAGALAHKNVVVMLW